jgi:hypothetical protein
MGQQYQNSSQGNTIQGSGLDSSVSECSPVTGCCEHGNELPGSIKGRAFLDSVSVLQAAKLRLCSVGADGHHDIRHFTNDNT